jgi:hypothetical protein
MGSSNCWDPEQVDPLLLFCEFVPHTTYVQAEFILNKLQYNPVITTSIYMTPRLQSQIFCGTN